MSFFMKTKTAGSWGNKIQVSGEGGQFTWDTTDYFTGGADTAKNMADALNILIPSLSFELRGISDSIIDITALFPGAAFNAYELDTDAHDRIGLSGATLTGGVDGELAIYTFNVLNEATVGDVVRFVKDDEVVFAIDPDGRITIDGEKAVETGYGEGYTGAGGTGAGAAITIKSGIITDMTPIT